MKIKNLKENYPLIFDLAVQHTLERDSSRTYKEVIENFTVSNGLFNKF